MPLAEYDATQSDAAESSEARNHSNSVIVNEKDVTVRGQQSISSWWPTYQSVTNYFSNGPMPIKISALSFLTFFCLSNVFGAQEVCEMFIDTIRNAFTNEDIDSNSIGIDTDSHPLWETLTSYLWWGGAAMLANSALLFLNLKDAINDYKNNSLKLDIIGLFLTSITSLINVYLADYSSYKVREYLPDEYVYPAIFVIFGASLVVNYKAIIKRHAKFCREKDDELLSQQLKAISSFLEGKSPVEQLDLVIEFLDIHDSRPTWIQAHQQLRTKLNNESWMRKRAGKFCHDHNLWDGTSWLYQRLANLSEILCLPGGVAVYFGPNELYQSFNVPNGLHQLLSACSSLTRTTLYFVSATNLQWKLFHLGDTIRSFQQTIQQKGVFAIYSIAATGTAIFCVVSAAGFFLTGYDALAKNTPNFSETTAAHALAGSVLWAGTAANQNAIVQALSDELEVKRREITTSEIQSLLSGGVGVAPIYFKDFAAIFADRNTELLRSTATADTILVTIKNMIINAPSTISHAIIEAISCCSRSRHVDNTDEEDGLLVNYASSAEADADHHRNSVSRDSGYGSFNSRSSGYESMRFFPFPAAIHKKNLLPLVPKCVENLFSPLLSLSSCSQ